MKHLIILLLTTCTSVLTWAQTDPEVLDQVVAVVGNEIVLQSDIDQQLAQMEQWPAGMTPEQARCMVLNQMLQQKMLLTRAFADSLEVDDAQVEGELEMRMNYFIQTLGSRERLEEFYGKSVVEIKEEFREPVRQQILIQRMHSKIMQSVTVTPSEVKKFFHNLPKDSLPYLSATVMAGELVRYPEPTVEAKVAAREKLEQIRQEILAGADFEVKAVLYSDDPGSASEGGDIGEVNRSGLEPEYADAAFRLDVDSLSPVIETRYGFHLIQLLGRKGELIHTRHILIRPKVGVAQQEKTVSFLDSLRNEILNDTLVWEEATSLYSQSAQTKNNGGFFVDQSTGSQRVAVEQLDPQVFRYLDTMEVGSISKAVPFQGQAQQNGFRLLYLRSKTPPHRANLEDDYQQIRKVALEQKKMERMEQWLNKFIPKTYIRISDEFVSCQQLQYWLQ